MTSPGATPCSVCQAPHLGCQPHWRPGGGWLTWDDETGWSYAKLETLSPRSTALASPDGVAARGPYGLWRMPNASRAQVIVDAETRLVIAAARLVQGTTADTHAWRASGLGEHCQGVTVLADGAYLHCGMAVPHRKRPGRSLLKGEEEDNAEHRRVLARVEHVIDRMKNYKILRDCRQRGDGLHHAVQAVAHMHNLALASRPRQPRARP